MITRRIATVTALGVSFAITLAGCSATGDFDRDGQSWSLVPDSEMSLGDAEAAVYLTAQSSTGQSETEGYLVLFNEERSWVQKTAGMDNGQLDWSANGLVYSDVDFDYRLTNDLVATKSEKTDFQQAIFDTKDGIVVGVYNEGFTDDGYREQLVTTSGGDASRSTIEGLYMVTGQCGDDIFGASIPTGEFEKQALANGLTVQGESGYESVMLQRLGGTGYSQELIGINAVRDSYRYATNAPCDGERLYSLAVVYDTDPDRAVLRSWNIQDGTMEDTELFHEDGTPVQVEGAYGIEIDGVSDLSLHDSSLDWVGVDGSVHETDTTTGVTRTLFRIAGEYDPTLDTRLSVFTDSSIATLTWNQAADTVSYRVQDRTDGTVTVAHELPLAAEIISSRGVVLHDLQLKPAHH